MISKIISFAIIIAFSYAIYKGVSFLFKKVKNIDISKLSKNRDNSN